MIKRVSHKADPFFMLQILGGRHLSIVTRHEHLMVSVSAKPTDLGVKVDIFDW